MFGCRIWPWVGLVCLAQSPLPVEAPAPGAAALQAWQEGQRAMAAGRNDEAIACYEHSLQLDPTLARNHLSLAAAFLAQGQDERAAPHLADYLEAQPDHLVIRAHYAELLLRLERRGDARKQFERFIAEVQDHEVLARQHLVHCHSRLMEIAEGEEDEYTEHLHRGIGLYLLARQLARQGDTEGEAAEGLLCKAAGELTVARLRRPDEARPYWYLYAVWSELAQQQPASRCLRAAEAAASLSYLTPAEQRDLYLACRQAGRDSLHKGR